jgi:hypothetical protein
MRRRTRSIALIYDATHVYDLKVMSGVAAYLQENDNFSVYIEENALKDQRLPDLHSWRGTELWPTLMIRLSPVPWPNHGFRSWASAVDMAGMYAAPLFVPLYEQ